MSRRKQIYHLLSPVNYRFFNFNNLVFLNPKTKENDNRDTLHSSIAILSEIIKAPMANRQAK